MRIYLRIRILNIDTTASSCSSSHCGKGLLMKLLAWTDLAMLISGDLLGQLPCWDDTRSSWPVVVDSDWRSITGVAWNICLVRRPPVKSPLLEGGTQLGKFCHLMLQIPLAAMDLVLGTSAAVDCGEEVEIVQPESSCRISCSSSRRSCGASCARCNSLTKQPVCVDTFLWLSGR